MHNKGKQQETYAGIKAAEEGQEITVTNPKEATQNLSWSPQGSLQTDQEMGGANGNNTTSLIEAKTNDETKKPTRTTIDTSAFEAAVAGKRLEEWEKSHPDEAKELEKDLETNPITSDFSILDENGDEVSE